MNPTDPPTCSKCSRVALVAPCSRQCGRLALVCGCPDVLDLDGLCAVCARAPRERVEVDVIAAPSPGIVPGSLREFARPKRRRSDV